MCSEFIVFNRGLQNWQVLPTDKYIAHILFGYPLQKHKSEHKTYVFKELLDLIWC